MATSVAGRALSAVAGCGSRAAGRQAGSRLGLRRTTRLMSSSLLPRQQGELSSCATSSLRHPRHAAAATRGLSASTSVGSSGGSGGDSGSGGVDGTHSWPQTEVFPGVPPNQAPDVSEPAATHITTLANGVRVASQDNPGPWCSVAMFALAGSRHELQGQTTGSTLFVDRLSFKGTENRDGRAIAQVTEALGGNFSCASNRDTIMYGASVFKSDLAQAVDLLSDVVLNPKYTQADVAELVNLIEFEHEFILDRPDILIPELIHSAAFGQATLGNNLFCSPEDAANVTPEMLHQFHSSLYIPSRLVISGAGMAHEELVDLVTQHFGSLESKPDPPSNILAPAKYTGGQAIIALDESPSRNALNRPLTQIAIGLRSVDWNSDDLYPMAVLYILLGGGGSFSAGGPGKGLYSRLYTNVLNIFHWMESAIAWNLAYEDAGLFYLQASSPPEKVGDAASILISELASAANCIYPEELSRARNQLKSALLMNLESRASTCEDIGRQVLASNMRMNPEEVAARIDEVTAEDVQGVLKRMLRQPLSVAAYGDVSQLPALEVLQQATAEFLNQAPSRRMGSLSNLFSWK